MRLVKLFNIDFVYGPRCGDAGEQRVFFIIIFCVVSGTRRWNDWRLDSQTRQNEDHRTQAQSFHWTSERRDWAQLG